MPRDPRKSHNPVERSYQERVAAQEARHAQRVAQLQKERRQRQLQQAQSAHQQPKKMSEEEALRILTERVAAARARHKLTSKNNTDNKR